ncbi:MAG: glycosyltransferase [Clostridia bacterium]|nr:glycosyltransferase [Clostridia bacterium]
MVSIVVPVFNAEVWLKETLGYLRAQTYRDIEILCVDDGSTDGSVAIIESAMQEDGRVRLIRQQNSFAGVARNNGIDHAKGEYIIFLDADDIFAPTLVEKCVCRAEKTQADIVLFGGDSVDMRTGEQAPSPWFFRYDRVQQLEVFDRRAIPDEIMNITNAAPWTKLYKTEFVRGNGLRFQPLRNSNDLYFVLLSLCVAERIAYVNEPLVRYRRFRPGSLQNTKESDPLCVLEAVEALYAALTERGIFSEVAASFAKASAEFLKHNLTTIRSRAALKRFCAALVASPVVNDAVLAHEPKDASPHESFVAVRGAKYMLACMEDADKRNLPGDTRCTVTGHPAEAPAVSVVIPVYNTGAYLAECLDSVLGQTLANIEVLCVDDGSTDGSRAVLEACAAKDPRVTVLAQSNRGQSAARNEGIRRAQGKYLYFMDSDDILRKEALSELLDTAERERTDVILFDGTVFYEDPAHTGGISATRYRRTRTREGVRSGKSLMSELCAAGEYSCSPCLQFVSHAYFLENGLWFPEGIIHEDNLYTFRTLLCAERAAYVNRAYFHRRVRKDSVMTAKKTYRHCYGEFVCYRSMVALMESFGLAEQTPENEAVAAVVQAFLADCHRDYRSLEEPERMFYKALPLDERMLFEACVLGFSKRYDKLERDYIALRNSRTYRLGNAIVGLPRLARNALRKLLGKS